MKTDEKLHVARGNNVDGLRATDMEDEALEIIVRHRPHLAGKTLAECREILGREFPAHKATAKKGEESRMG
jgi:hypothetical protein